jgi:acetoin utilization deacetylase AcuC-like enzyme
MILYDPSIAMRFPEYGILIPVLDSRAESILRSLRAELGTPDEAWLKEGVSVRVSREDVARVHEAAFVSRLFDGPRSLEAELLKTYELIGPDGKPHRYEPETATRPLSALFGTILRQVAGTCEACAIALERGFCYYLGGGMHHARRDGGSGFCLLNDSMIAVAGLRAEGRVRTAWIIDVDAHKGDGTAEIALHDPDTLTLSVHMADGWPLDPESLEAARREGRGTDAAPLAPSDVDIPIARGEDGGYVRKLAEGLAELERLSGGRRPELALVVDGADPYVHDGLASSADMALSLDQCVERDLLIRDFLRARNIPSAWIMAGGYGPRAWEPPAAFLAAALRG